MPYLSIFCIGTSVNQGILYQDPFLGFEAETEKVIHKSLTKEELDKFMAVVPRLEQQEIAKDLFYLPVLQVFRMSI